MAPKLEEEPSKAMSTVGEAAKELAEFEEKVKKTIYIDNLSPQASRQVIEAAINQCAVVVNVEIIPNMTIPYNIPQSALVELQNERQVKTALEMIEEMPFMIAGMPRPVRAVPAKAEMFPNRPSPPDKKIQFCWLKPSDPDYEVSQKLKQLARKHEAEHLALIKYLMEEEEKLAKHQQSKLDENFKKTDLIGSAFQDGTIKRLARCYGISLEDDF